LQETLKEELKDTCAAVSSLKEDIDHLHDGTKTSKKDAAILERNRCAVWVHIFNITFL
jgi:hypothetical protein